MCCWVAVAAVCFASGQFIWRHVFYFRVNERAQGERKSDRKNACINCPFFSFVFLFLPSPAFFFFFLCGHCEEKRWAQSKDSRGGERKRNVIVGDTKDGGLGLRSRCSAMLRWTGGSKARASFWQPSGDYSTGFRGADNDIHDSRSRNIHHCHPTTSHEWRSRHPFYSDNRNETKGFPRRSYTNRDATVASSSESGGRRSPSSARREGRVGGVDCMALEWSLKAAAAAAASSSAKLQRQEALEGWKKPTCNMAVGHSRAEDHSLALGDAAHPECQCNHAESTMAAQMEPRGLELPCPGFGEPRAEETWTEPACSPPFHVSSWEPDAWTLSDAPTWAPQECFLSHLPESAEEWELKECNEFPPPLSWGETHHDPMNVFLDQRTFFASSNVPPEDKKVNAFLDESVTAWMDDDYPCDLLWEEYIEPAAAREGEWGGVWDIPIVPGCLPGAAITRTGESVGCWTPTHSDIYAETSDQACFDGSLLLQTPKESSLGKCRSPVVSRAEPNAVLALTSMLRGMNQSQRMPYAHSRESFTHLSRGRGGRNFVRYGSDAAMREPYGFQPHSGQILSDQTPAAARGGGMRGRGRGWHRGYSSHLSGGVPSSRFQAFQRRYRRG
ncbi:hypothetical protein, conserved [Trypanosoma cruzi]|uniref:Uncharacterized protein n=1 Tax=Trypanosoma cruzi (strain CL Brener) TaxID=353153 RepID=Q4DN23_TRYCC|nr:hypothetical protein, conserved [Trypanosoma cruzi]EAN93933.1 hypothetical protein, conserved [Trypanosoma cruzi]|eukprot:XP_815784.1 hypothetical protein [Trypanosoma cruzi strain CL Brener]